MKFNGTPGPWKVLTLCKHWNNDQLEHLQVTYGDDGECICDTVYDVSDANLIAAAPDLLYSLQKLLTEYKFTRSQLNGDTEEDLVDVLCVRNAMVAINKALGNA